MIRILKQGLIALILLLGVGNVSVFLLSSVSGNNLAQAEPIEGTSDSYMRHSFWLKGTRYVPLIILCQSYEIDWDWDLVTRLVRITKNNRQVILVPGQERILVDGAPAELSRPVEIYCGSIVVPASEVRRLLANFTATGMIQGTKPLIVSPELYGIKKVVIDPGHGGKDPGAIGPSGLKEKDVVLDIALELRRLLEDKGLEVIMTRSDDRFVPLGRRARIANNRQADFFISIHANSARYRGVDGFEVYYLSEAIDDNARAVAVAENAALRFEEDVPASVASGSRAIVWDIINTENRIESVELAETLCASVEDLSLLKNRGIKGANFYVLRGAMMPAVLVEVGFISNRAEEARLATRGHRWKIASALVAGITRYKQPYKKTSSF